MREGDGLAAGAIGAGGAAGAAGGAGAVAVAVAIRDARAGARTFLSSEHETDATTVSAHAMRRSFAGVIARTVSDGPSVPGHPMWCAQGSVSTSVRSVAARNLIAAENTAGFGCGMVTAR